MFATSSQNHFPNESLVLGNAVFGKKIGLLAMIFGCWHRDLSRPFVSETREGYRVCTDCGARRRFDAQNLKTSGSFYYPPQTIARQ